MKIALIGAGQRGMIYAGYMAESFGEEIAAVVEPNEIRRNIAKEKFDIKDENVFTNSEEFFEKGKLADIVIIASMDRDHYEQVMQALDCGYDILLEKPISPNPEECLRIEKKAHEVGRKITVCHVLRYTNFFSEIKNIIDSGELGKVMTIQHAENIGNFHMAHSFVRGNWRNSEESSPIIMQKSCHDMDILVWLAGSGAKKISSFGSLDYFKEENAPEDELEEFLDKKVESVKKRIKEATGIEVEPIYYSAGYKEEGYLQQKPYNLSKLLYYILQNTPEEKRVVYVQNLNQEEVMWKDNDDLKDYRKGILESILGAAVGVLAEGVANVVNGVANVVEGASDGISEGSDTGSDVGGAIGSIFGEVGETIGSAVGSVVGGVVGGVVGAVSSAVSSVCDTIGSLFGGWF